MNVVLEEIYNSTLKLLAPLTPDETYAKIIEEAKKLVRAESGSIFLADESGLRRVYSTVPQDLQVEPRKEGYTYRAFLERRSLVIPAADMKKYHPELDPRICSVVIIPLAFNEETIGVLTLRLMQRTRFSRRKLQMLKLFGSVVTLKLRNVELFTDMRKALETKDLFLAMASHELKTPLTAITGYVDLIHHHAEDGMTIDPKWITTMKAEMMHLSKLVNDLLSVHMIHTGTHYEFAKCHLNHILVAAVREVQSAFPSHSIQMSSGIDTDLIVEADCQKLREALTHILMNAAKFSEESDVINMYVQQQGEKIWISIIDRGMGIEDKDHERIFDVFYKGSIRSHTGMGVGLYICKRIIESHKGQITIVSKRQLGTTVDITLPLIQHVSSS